MDCHMHIAVGCIMAILVSFPDNVYEFNNYMCGLMNRRGPLHDGFGPALTSEIFTCSNCTNIWYGVPLYLLVEFLPVT